MSGTPADDAAEADGGPEQTMRYTAVATAIGTAHVACTDKGICFLRTDLSDEEVFADLVRQRLGATLRRDDAAAPRLERTLSAWLAGRQVAAPVDLTRLTPFEQRVLAGARRIRRGWVRSYAWLAAEIGSPRAVRAVGTALARNPVSLLVPCHRVVTSGGRIGNYNNGGPTVKADLLRREGVDVDRLQAWAARGIRLKGSRTTRIYCYPTCREITPPHLVLFRSVGEALAAGFRPCRVCRPPAGGDGGRG